MQRSLLDIVRTFSILLRTTHWYRLLVGAFGHRMHGGQRVLPYDRLPPASNVALALRRALSVPPILRADIMSNKATHMRALVLGTLNFLICARPGSVRELLKLQLRKFKY